MDKFLRGIRSLQNRGLRGGLLHGIGKAFDRCVSFNPHSGKPSISEIANATDTYLDPKALIDSLQSSEYDANKIAAYFDEYALLDADLLSRYNEKNLNAPENWRIEKSSAQLLYTLIRLTRPKTVVETGVANGHSAVVITNALMKNGMGQLISVDISDDVGSLLTPKERKNWRLLVLDRPYHKNLDHTFSNVIDCNVDMFIHDSDHTYFWMFKELNAIWDKMRQGGMLLCDDIDLSYGFCKFIEIKNLHAKALIQDRKILGLVVKE